jgi:Transposase and inactivated derivatives, IS5 family
MIRPYYFNNKCGRKPIGIESMLRMYLMQIWFNLSDEGIEDSIYDSDAIRTFMHLDFNEQQVPDATTLLKFRHLLEKNKIGEKLFADVNKRLDETGLIMHGGTVVDASLIAASKSTKNQSGKRDPEMHQAPPDKMEFFYPVTPHTALLLTTERKYVSGQTLKIGIHEVAKYNALQLRASREQIFSKDKTQLETFLDVHN